MIPYGKQSISQEDIDGVIEVLQSDFLTTGPKVPLFEQAICTYTTANYATAVNSATSALHIACKALGLSPGDTLWTSPITFVASANCALYCGAKVDFVDIDPDTYNLCPQALAKKLEIAKQNNQLPKIVIPVHMCGQSCEMEEIYKLSLIYGFNIIEDASHAIGGRYQDQPVGNCRYADITVFSFHPVKIITSGEGGIAVTNNTQLAKTMDRLRNHGLTRIEEEMFHESDGPWYYEQIELGHNYRMTDIHAALGISQIKRLDGFVSKRNQLAENYNRQLKDLPLQLPQLIDDAYSSYHLYIIGLAEKPLIARKKTIFTNLQKAGIGVNLHYIPIYKQPYFQSMGFSKNLCLNAENYYQQAITLPLYPELSDSEQNFVIEKLKEELTR
jgi:UDP-4-amino-4,6-dideoxy-N-acetyl-beta-L-altrosamine transaminase